MWAFSQPKKIRLLNNFLQVTFILVNVIFSQKKTDQNLICSQTKSSSQVFSETSTLTEDQGKIDITYYKIDFEIDFPSQLVSRQSCQLQLINGNYKTDIAAARTFGFEKDVEHLRSNGLALGGSLDNAVVVGENEILNKDGLRYTDEFVRHKILDSIGDLYLAGSPIIGYFYGNKSGHYLNNQLLRKLFSDESNYEYIA